MRTMNNTHRKVQKKTKQDKTRTTGKMSFI